MRVSLVQLRKHHPLFLSLSFESCKEIINKLPLIVLENTQLLYKEGEYISSAYIIIMGKIIVHTKVLGTIGVASIGDVVGEECLNKNIKYTDRKESAYSSGLTFLLELTQSSWTQLKNIFTGIDAKLDLRKLTRLIENWSSKKLGWKQHKKRTNNR